MSNIQSRSYNMNRDHSAAADLVIKSCANRLDNIISLIMDHLYYSIKCVVVCESWLSENVFPIKYADSLLWIFSNGKNYRDKSIICQPPFTSTILLASKNTTLNCQKKLLVQRSFIQNIYC